MKRKILFLVLAVIILLAVIIFISNQKSPANQMTGESRNFYLGVVPTPKNFPNSTFDDITAAYEETGKIAEVTMVWTGVNIGQTEKLKQNRVITALGVYGLKPILTLNFATIKEIPGKGLQYVIDAPEGVKADLDDPQFRSQWIGEAKSLAEEFRPPYLSLGNEINDYFYLHPDDLKKYFSLYDEAYKEIKAVSPKTKVFVVFSYTHLIDNNQWDLLRQFNGQSDLIGLTTYPRAHFDDPSQIPEDYYTRLNDYVDKPIAFTEIGWPSTPATGDSEKKQADFLTKFLELTKVMNIEMINWLFLHETEIGGVAGKIVDPGTASISLKNKDGTEKEVYGVWLRIKKIPYRR